MLSSIGSYLLGKFFLNIPFKILFLFVKTFASNFFSFLYNVVKFFCALFRFSLLGESLPYNFFYFVHIFWVSALFLFHYLLEKKISRIFLQCILSICVSKIFIHSTFLSNFCWLQKHLKYNGFLSILSSQICRLASFHYH